MQTPLTMDKPAVKPEPAADSGDDSSPDLESGVKEELDVEPTVLQPIDIQYMLQPYKVENFETGPPNVKVTAEGRVVTTPRGPKRPLEDDKLHFGATPKGTVGQLRVRSATSILNVTPEGRAVTTARGPKKPEDDLHFSGTPKGTVGKLREGPTTSSLDVTAEGRAVTTPRGPKKPLEDDKLHFGETPKGAPIGQFRVQSAASIFVKVTAEGRVVTTPRYPKKPLEDDKLHFGGTPKGTVGQLRVRSAASMLNVTAEGRAVTTPRGPKKPLEGDKLHFGATPKGTPIGQLRESPTTSSLKVTAEGRVVTTPRGPKKPLEGDKLHFGATPKGTPIGQLRESPTTSSFVKVTAEGRAVTTPRGPKKPLEDDKLHFGATPKGTVGKLRESPTTSSFVKVTAEGRVVTTPKYPKRPLEDDKLHFGATPKGTVGQLRERPTTSSLWEGNSGSPQWVYEGLFGEYEADRPEDAAEELDSDLGVEETDNNYDILNYPMAVVDGDESLRDLPFTPIWPPDVGAEVGVWTEREPDPITVEVEVEIHTEPEQEPGPVAAKSAAIAVGREVVRDASERNRGCPLGRRGDTGNAECVVGDRLVQAYPRDEDIPAEMMQTATARAHVGGRGRGVQGRGIAATPGVTGEPSDDIRNENVDADDEATCLFGNDPEAMKFDWQPIESFSGQQEVFLPQSIGPTEYFDSAYEAFRAIWTDEILDQIVTETNRYAEQFPNPRAPFKPTNAHEILILFAFYMLLGIVRYPTIDACFSKCYLFCNKSFSTFFSRSRYFELSSKLHFSNNLTADRTSKLFKINPVLEHLNRRFQALYVPRRNITIDESLNLWKGLINFKQYVPDKTARVEIKSFKLCCSTSRYLWSFFVRTEPQGAEGDQASVGCPKVIPAVLALIRPLLHKGYTLWMDNCFNSPMLARFLKRNQTDCVGTLRKSRKHVPQQVVKVPLKKGQYMARTSQDTCIGRVTTISTFHGDETEMGPSKGRNYVYKPKVVRDYNKFMGGGWDKKDRMLEPCRNERRCCQKWYLKLFKSLLNASVLNSRILVEESTGHQVEHLKFCTSLVREIYSRHYNQYPTRHRHTNANFEQHEDDRYDVGAGHFPVQLSASDVGGSGATDAPIDMTRPNKTKRCNNDKTQVTKRQCVRKRCVYCQERNKQNNQRSDNKTTFRCNVCKVALCCTPCFELYHTRSANRNPAPNSTLG